MRAPPCPQEAPARWRGLWSLFRKELLRFLKVPLQTLLAPVVTAALYLLVFSHALRQSPPVYGTLDYESFLVPGLVMMSLIQNAFANSSSSLIQSKVTGNLVFVLLAPLSYWEFYLGYLLAAMVRGLLVGVGVLLVALPFASGLGLHHPAYALAFALLGGALLGTLGVVAGIHSEKFDQLAGFQNFVILPLSFLSGVFYSLHSLPDFWRQLSWLNPFFYLIDGFRYGFFGVSDADPGLSLAVASSSLAALAGLTLHLLRTGYRLRP